MDTMDTKKRYRDPKICACSVDAFTSYIKILKKQIEYNRPIKYYIDSLDRLYTLNNLLKRVATKCGLIKEYNTIYFYRIKDIEEELKDYSPNFEKLMSLIDELQDTVWSDICYESASDYNLPMTTELTEEELKKYDLTEEELKEYGLLEEGQHL